MSTHQVVMRCREAGLAHRLSDRPEQLRPVRVTKSQLSKRPPDPCWPRSAAIAPARAGFQVRAVASDSPETGRPPAVVATSREIARLNLRNPSKINSACAAASAESASASSSQSSTLEKGSPHRAEALHALPCQANEELPSSPFLRNSSALHRASSIAS